MTIALLSHVPLDAGYPERFAAADLPSISPPRQGSAPRFPAKLAQQFRPC